MLECVGEVVPNGRLAPQPFQVRYEVVLREFVCPTMKDHGRSELPQLPIIGSRGRLRTQLFKDSEPVEMNPERRRAALPFGIVLSVRYDSFNLSDGMAQCLRRRRWRLIKADISEGRFHRFDPSGFQGAP
ncbi:MAG: hypothetical protein ABIP48_06940 [Planctomycetota bacterium]